MTVPKRIKQSHPKKKSKQNVSIFLKLTRKGKKSNLLQKIGHIQTHQ